jgi:hypothetical protein
VRAVPNSLCQEIENEDLIINFSTGSGQKEELLAPAVVPR